MARVTTITSKDNPLLVKLRKLLAQPDAYRRIGEFWIEGPSLCRAWAGAAASADVMQVVVSAAAWADPSHAALARGAPAVAVVDDALRTGLGTLETSASIGFLVRWKGPGALDPAAPSIVLDRLQDAGNVGTILRSAAAFGFAQVVALKGTAALWSPKVLRAAMGAHAALKLVESADATALDALAMPLLATSSHAALAIHEAALPWPAAWVVGNEGQGVAEEVMRRCAATLRIPQPGGEESLNVGAAAAVCMYESMRRRLRP
jgi:TrmH family RNA methyltransferase